MATPYHPNQPDTGWLTPAGPDWVGDFGNTGPPTGLPPWLSPLNPVNPLNPLQPNQPVAPNQPVDPLNPLDPLSPLKPLNPLAPLNPVQPVSPLRPWLPGEPTGGGGGGGISAPPWAQPPWITPGGGGGGMVAGTAPPSQPTGGPQGGGPVQTPTGAPGGGGGPAGRPIDDGGLMPPNGGDRPPVSPGFLKPEDSGGGYMPAPGFIPQQQIAVQQQAPPPGWNTVAGPDWVGSFGGNQMQGGPRDKMARPTDMDSQGNLIDPIWNQAAGLGGNVGRGPAPVPWGQQQQQAPGSGSQFMGTTPNTKDLMQPAGGGGQQAFSMSPGGSGGQQQQFGNQSSPADGGGGQQQIDINTGVTVDPGTWNPGNWAGIGQQANQLGQQVSQSQIQGLPESMRRAMGANAASFGNEQAQNFAQQAAPQVTDMFNTQQFGRAKAGADMGEALTQSFVDQLQAYTREQELNYFMANQLFGQGY